MSQASDLGAIANQLAALYRARVNANLQAITTQHYGATEPPAVYPNMLWFDSGTGQVKLRNPTNTAWAVVGTIGPPFKWTAVDVPQTASTTGDVKVTYNPAAPAGWILLNDGSIGNAGSGAVTRAAPDCQALFELMWTISVDDFCPVYAAGTWTRTGRGASAAADWAAARHLLLPKTIGHVFGCWGVSSHLGASLGIATWHGAHSVALNVGHLPQHSHTFSIPNHNHALARSLPNFVAGKSSSSGPYTLADQASGITWSEAGGGHSGNTSSAGSGAPLSVIQPTTYANYIIKL